MKQIFHRIALLILIACMFGAVSAQWTQVGSDINGEAAGDFVDAVAMSSDGRRVIIGAPGNDGSFALAGHARVFEEIAGAWVQVGSDIDGEAANDLSSSFVAISGDGTHVAVTAAQNDGNGNASGHARIFEEVAGVWIQIGSDIDGLAANDLLQSVELSFDGSRVVVGSPGNDLGGNGVGLVRVFEDVAGVWTQVGSNLLGEDLDDAYGCEVSMSSNGQRIAISSSKDRKSVV